MILERFGDYTFPVFNVADSLGAAARADMYPTPLGGYDPNGSEDAIDRIGQITKRCEVNEFTSGATFQAALDAARGIRGKKERLWARTAADTDGESEVRWLWARCASIAVERTARNVRYQALVFTFTVPLQVWNGVGHADWALDDGTELDTGYYLDTGNYEGDLVSSPDSFDIENGGNHIVTNIILAVTAGSVAITNLVVNIGESTLQFNGTIAAGQTLLIDSGSYRVTNNGADAYNDLELHASLHLVDDWFRIEPGHNVIAFAWTGGGVGSNWTMNFWDGWY